MKNIFQLLFILLLSTITFISCDDEIELLEKTEPTVDEDNQDGDNNDDTDDNSNTTNFIQYGDIKIELVSGLVANYGLSDEPKDYEGNNLELGLFSDGISLDVVKDDLDEVINYELTGSGTILYVNLFSESGDLIQDGTYEFDDQSEVIKVLHFDESDFYYNYNITSEQGDEFGITGGTYTISYMNENYTIDFDLLLENNEPITGHYEGELQYFDLSE